MTIRRSAFLWLPVILLLITGLAYWAPWITQEFAEQRAVQAFATAWQGVIDGCGFNCTGCGAVDAQKTGFGYRVELEYGCGMMPEDTAQYHDRTTVFVSFVGTVHGFSSP
jgi:hypothetical protein